MSTFAMISVMASLRWWNAAGEAVTHYKGRVNLHNKDNQTGMSLVFSGSALALLPKDWTMTTHKLRSEHAKSRVVILTNRKDASRIQITMPIMDNGTDTSKRFVATLERLLND